MSQQVRFELLEPVCDPRGLVVEPLDAELLARQRNVHVVLTEPGQVRGNHYHRRGSEETFVVGPALFRYREDGAVRELTIAPGQACRISIPPGVTHAFQNIGTQPLLLIGFNTEPHDRARPDTVRDVLIEAGPAGLAAV
jgi:mannose-6-phosphate isomerase-like protein (cupin superfamily)